MPIISNFHFSPNLTKKLNFSTDTQFISLDQDKIIPAHKNLLFLTENYPLTQSSEKWYILFSFYSLILPLVPFFVQILQQGQKARRASKRRKGAGV